MLSDEDGAVDEEMPVVGAVLAGGQARRMGGGDKCLLPVLGRPILAHIVERLSPQCGYLLLNANGDLSRFAAFGLPVVPDEAAQQAGPLAGLLAALDHAAAIRPQARDVLTVPGDTPFLPRDLRARLGEARQEAGAAIACAASGGRTHPVVALWPVRLRGDLRRALAEGERAVARFARRYPLAIAQWPAEPDPFHNVNTPEDLAATASRGD